MRLAEICLITDDVLALVRYYSMILESPFEGDDTHAQIALHGMGIAFYNREVAGRDMSLVFGQVAGTGRAVMNFSVEDVDGHYERLRGLGISFLNPPTDQPWGSRSMQWLDPDGNMLSFHSRIPSN